MEEKATPPPPLRPNRGRRNHPALLWTHLVGGHAVGAESLLQCNCHRGTDSCGQPPSPSKHVPPSGTGGNGPAISTGTQDGGPSWRRSTEERGPAPAAQVATALNQAKAFPAARRPASGSVGRPTQGGRGGFPLLPGRRGGGDWRGRRSPRAGLRRSRPQSSSRREPSKQSLGRQWQRGLTGSRQRYRACYYVPPGQRTGEGLATATASGEVERATPGGRHDAAGTLTSRLLGRASGNVGFGAAALPCSCGKAADCGASSACQGTRITPPAVRRHGQARGTGCRGAQ